ncbi:MAG: DUF167 domain-containing protein [Propionibacteriaceae bacterium]|jgi:uncharacterized protein (TIGR00251 family)|nr:DUF167 domain-containing protein [Propionibacteriaceae bacterium]
MRVSIRVKPGSSRNRVGGAYPLPDGATPALIVATTAPAVDGKANAAVIKLLAKSLEIRAAAITVVSGHTARTKLLEVPDDRKTQWARLLASG